MKIVKFIYSNLFFILMKVLMLFVLVIFMFEVIEYLNNPYLNEIAKTIVDNFIALLGAVATYAAALKVPTRKEKK